MPKPAQPSQPSQPLARRTQRKPAPRTHRVEALTPHLFVPSPARPVRAKVYPLAASTEVAPHRHPWAQLAFSAVGVLRLSTASGTYLAPPSRAVWVPPGVEHTITVLEDAELRTLYLHQPAGSCGPDVDPAAQAPWRQCRVLEVSALLRALVLELDTRADDEGAASGSPVSRTSQPAPATNEREQLISRLVLDELRRAHPVPLGVDLPADKRLRGLCEAMLADPARHQTLQAWAHDSGASPRTLARLFRSELATSFGQWRQRVVLAQALALAAQRRPMGWIAAELGYASPSAFAAMVRRAVGQPPSRFFASAG